MKEGLFSEYGLICLTDLDKRRLNNLARTALLTKNADVIISLGAQQVISREFKPAKTHMTWKKILIQKPRIRFPRADMDIPVKKHIVHNWETCCKNYRATRRLCSSHYRKHFSNTEVQRCIIHRWTYQEFDEKLRRAIEGGAIERLYQTKPLAPLRTLVKRLYFTERQEQNYYKKLRAQMFREFTPHEIRWMQRSYRWRKVEAERIHLKAAYFNEQLIYWREYFKSHPEFKTYKVRRLRACRDTYNTVYYRNMRDKYVPREAFTYGFIPATHTAPIIYHEPSAS